LICHHRFSPPPQGLGMGIFLHVGAVARRAAVGGSIVHSTIIDIINTQEAPA